MSPGIHTERAFEDRVEFELFRHGWQTATGLFSAELGIYTGALWEFVGRTQAKSGASFRAPSLSVDMALFVNGLPVATVELKNPNTGQNADHAIASTATAIRTTSSSPSAPSSTSP